MFVPKFLVLALLSLALLLCLSSQTHAQSRTVDLHAKEIYELQTYHTTNGGFIYIKVSDIVAATADVKTKCVDKTDSSLLVISLYGTSSTTSFLFSHILAAYLNKKQIYVTIQLPNTQPLCTIKFFSTR